MGSRLVLLCCGFAVVLNLPQCCCLILFPGLSMFSRPFEVVVCERGRESEKTKKEKQSLAQDFAEVAGICLCLFSRLHLCVDCSMCR